MRTTTTCLLAGLLALAATDATHAQGRSPRGQQTAAEQRAARTAERVAREPNPRHAGAARRDDQARREERRAERGSSTDGDAGQRHGRAAPPGPLAAREFGRDVALRHQLAHVDRMRDEALLSGDQLLLDRADAMEGEIRQRFATIEANSQGSQRQFGRFTTGDIQPPPEGEVQPLPEVSEFDRGLGRETARQVRGLPPFAEGEVDIGAPGFGRRTAAERRYLRGDEPTSPWDAQYWPMPHDPPLTGGEPTPSPATEPTAENFAAPTDNVAP